jgi:Carboxypeptidase regulatory-like domain
MSNPPIDPETGNPMSLRDIAHYDASIVRVTPPVGTSYWKIVDAHHLSGQQNKGNHNVYIDMRNADGTRRNGAHCNLYFDGDKTSLLSNPPRAVLTIDKPANELGGTNAPMFRGNFYAVEGADMPSDKATGFSSVHPDEEGGNTDGHHSFMVVFQETLAAGGGGVQTGGVRGNITNGAGLTVTLTGGNVNLSATVGGDGSFSFDNVPAGTYNLAITGTSVASSVVVSAGQTTSVTLTVPGNGGNLQQELNQAIAERDKYKNLLAQIKQLIQNSGL